MLSNIFDPVFEASINPGKYPLLDRLLEEISGFDSVDDEGIFETVNSYSNWQEIAPNDWTSEENPPYSYWAYYFYVNIRVLNELRFSKCMNTYSFRPHCGETGSPEHLSAAFLTSLSVNHGIVLKQNPVLLYLYYLY